MKPKPLTLTVNGEKRPVAIADENETLLRVLRETLDLTGTKFGCGEGQCGACTVLVDGKATRSCLTPAVETANKRVTTIEGLAQGDHLHPLQEAFLVHDAMQCGYCVSGMIMNAAGLLKQNPHPTDAEILAAMQGNVCRCGTYPRILAAIQHVAAGKGAKRNEAA